MDGMDISPDDRAAEARLLAFLDEIGVEWTLHRHAPIFTVEEATAETEALPGVHTKNLFLKAKNGELLLVSCRSDRRIRIADLEKAVGARRLSFGSPELLMEALGVRPGSVTAFALFNDRARRVRPILDAQMLREAPLNFHPLHNAATLSVSLEGYRAFLSALDRTAEEVDFDTLEAKAAAREAGAS